MASKLIKYLYLCKPQRYRALVAKASNEASNNQDAMYPTHDVKLVERSSAFTQPQSPKQYLLNFVARKRLKDTLPMLAAAPLANAADDTSKPKIIVPEDVKWELLNADPATMIKGAIIPWANLNFFQAYILFPFTYGIMYTLNFGLNFMPWYGTIIASTVLFRLLLLPVHLKQFKNSIKINNIQPDQQRIQANIRTAIMNQDEFEVQRNRHRLSVLFQEQGMTQFSPFKPVLIQAPVFLSMFMCLRKLCEHNAEGLSEGGALWFQNLMISDPYYILPILSAASTHAIIALGIEGRSMDTMTPVIRVGLHAMPWVLLYFIHTFPASILLYWSTNNFISLLSALAYRTKFVRTKFDIPEKIIHDRSKLPNANKGFMQQIREAKDQANQGKSIAEIRRLDDLAFRKAATAPLKTYKTKPDITT